MTRPVFCRYVEHTGGHPDRQSHLKTIGQSEDKQLPQKTQTLRKQTTATTRETETTDSY